MHFIFILIYKLNSLFQLLFFCRNLSGLIINGFNKCRSSFVMKVLKYACLKFAKSMCGLFDLLLKIIWYDFHLKNKMLNCLQMYHTNLDFISSATKLGNLYDLFCASHLVKWMGHKIINLYYTFDTRYLCFLNDLLYEMSIVFFVRYISTLDNSHIGLTAKHFILKKWKCIMNKNYKIEFK